MKIYELTPMQAEVFKVYGNGWYRHITDRSLTLEEIEKEFEGDTLALYIFRELGDADASVSDAISYINTARNDLEDVIGVLESMEETDE